MSTKNADFKINNGSGWDNYHFKTNSGQVAHTTEDGEQTTVEDELKRQNSNLDNGNIGGFRITHKRIILSYETATSLSGYAYCGGNVIAANATIIYQASTPIDQVDRIYITIGAYGAPGRINVYAQGSGFISGHVLAVDAIIITEPI